MRKSVVNASSALQADAERARKRTAEIAKSLFIGNLLSPGWMREPPEPFAPPAILVSDEGLHRGLDGPGPACGRRHGSGGLRALLARPLPGRGAPGAPGPGPPDRLHQPARAPRDA